MFSEGAEQGSVTLKELRERFMWHDVMSVSQPVTITWRVRRDKSQNKYRCVLLVCCVRWFRWRSVFSLPFASLSTHTRNCLCSSSRGQNSKQNVKTLQIYRGLKLPAQRPKHNPSSPESVPSGIQLARPAIGCHGSLEAEAVEMCLLYSTKCVISLTQFLYKPLSWNKLE
jgi:hypothetical protein